MLQSRAFKGEKKILTECKYREAINSVCAEEIYHFNYQLVIYIHVYIYMYFLCFNGFLRVSQSGLSKAHNFPACSLIIFEAIRECFSNQTKISVAGIPWKLYRQWEVILISIIVFKIFQSSYFLIMGLNDNKC